MNGDDPSGVDENHGDGETGNPFAEVPAPAGMDPPAAPLSGSPSPGSPTSHARRWIIGILAVAVVIVGAVVSIIISSTSTGITTGTGTATITWIAVNGGNSDTIGNPPQTFTGTADGTSLSGVATTPLTTANGQKITGLGQLSQKIQFIEWKGLFGGKPFNVGVYADTSGISVTNPEEEFPKLTIAGTWGSERIVGRIATPTAAELKKGNPPAHFSGTVGDLKVSGTAQIPVGGGKHPMGTATFTVSR